MIQSRRPTSLRMGRRLLVSSEGKLTERSYFSSLASSLRIPNVNIVFLPHTCTDPLNLVKNVVQAWNENVSEGSFSPHKGDQPWVIFDVDEHREARPTEFAQAISLARENSVHIAATNPSFEFWLLKHFCFKSANMHRDAALSELRMHLNGYDKDITESFKKILFKNLAVAISNSEKLENRNKGPGYTGDEFYNPSTYAHHLAKQILEIADRIQRRPTR